MGGKRTDAWRALQTLTDEQAEALAALTDDWQFGGDDTFNESTARSLAADHPLILTRDLRFADDRWRPVYRLTSFGTQVKARAAI